MRFGAVWHDSQEPQCPECLVSGRFKEVEPGDVELPNDHLREREKQETIWHCDHCGTVWYRSVVMDEGPRTGKCLRVKNRIVGLYNAPGVPPGFVSRAAKRIHKPV